MAIKHGLNGYKEGCRCPVCRNAKAIYARKCEEHRIEKDKNRRLEALMESARPQTVHIHNVGEVEI